MNMEKMAPTVLKENNQIPVLSISWKFFYLLIHFLPYYHSSLTGVEIDFKGRIITIIQSLVFETSFSCKSFSESKISHFLLQQFLIPLFQLLKSLRRQNNRKGSTTYGLPRWCSGAEPVCQCRRRKSLRCDPWVDESLEEGMATLSSIPA